MTRSLARATLAALSAVTLRAGVAGAAAPATPLREPGPPSASWMLAHGENPHPVRLVLPPHRPLSAAAQLGRKLFFDPALSGSGKLSCASCHRPDHAYAPANALSVQLGGGRLTRHGVRAEHKPLDA